MAQRKYFLILCIAMVLVAAIAIYLYVNSTLWQLHKIYGNSIQHHNREYYYIDNIGDLISLSSIDINEARVQSTDVELLIKGINVDLQDDKNVLSLQVINHADYAIQLISDLVIETKINGRWYQCINNEQGSGMIIGPPIMVGDTRDIQVNLINIKGNLLPKGSYRISIHMMIPSGYITAEFII